MLRWSGNTAIGCSPRTLLSKAPDDIRSIDGCFQHRLWAAVTLGGFALLFSELRRLDTQLDGGLKEMRDGQNEMRDEWRKQRLELAEEFRAQRAEVLAQTTALANAITATRR
jgi:hypothetical protein